MGGGGTIAYILANKGIDVIDCGVPVLSMHAPYEVTSKFDIYSAFETYKAFWMEWNMFALSNFCIIKFYIKNQIIKFF